MQPVNLNKDRLRSTAWAHGQQTPISPIKIPLEASPSL